MQDPTRWIVLAVIVLTVAAGLYFWPQSPKDAPKPAPVPVVRPEIAPKAESKSEPQVRFPVPQAGDPRSLPALAQSDGAMREALTALFGRKIFEALFSQDNVIRRIVATVDNLPREKAAQRLMPVKSAAGLPLLTGSGENRAISAANSARYLPYVALAESVDTGKLAAAYFRHYPLFQQAYRELGFPQEHFNDRLVQVIDHLLATPDIKGPVKLVQRKVLYEFADPGLETRSAGQKILIRIGPENAARVKAKLRDIRRELTARATKP